MTQHLDLDASINTLQQLAKQGKDDPFNYMNVLCSTMDALIDRLRKAEAASKQPVAWFTEDHLTDKSATTWDQSVAERWRVKGWPVGELFAAPTSADSEGENS